MRHPSRRACWPCWAAQNKAMPARLGRSAERAWPSAPPPSTRRMAEPASPGPSRLATRSRHVQHRHAAARWPMCASAAELQTPGRRPTTDAAAGASPPTPSSRRPSADSGGGSWPSRVTSSASDVEELDAEAVAACRFDPARLHDRRRPCWPAAVGALARAPRSGWRAALTAAHGPRRAVWPTSWRRAT